MNTLILADNLKSGGGKVVGLNYINSFCEIYSSDNLYVICPKQTEYIDMIKENGIPNDRVTFSKKNIKKSRVTNFINGEYKRYLKKNSITTIINLTNIPLPIKGIQQILLIHKAFMILKIFSEETVKITSLKQRIRLFYEQFYLKYSMRYISTIIVQTNYMKELFENNISDQKKIKVVPSGSNYLLSRKKEELFIKENTRTKLYLPSKNYKHKNLEILIEVAEIAKQNLDDSFIIYLTLEDENSLLKSIELKEISNYFINLGVLNHTTAQQTYFKMDSLIMPTLLESFCLPLVEASKANLTTLVSDLPFSNEICGKNAIYFNPHSADDIYEKIKVLQQNKVLVETQKNDYCISWNESLSRILK